MAFPTGSTVVGVFDDHTQADKAIADLRKAGFRDDQIGVASRKPQNWDDSSHEKTTETHGGTGALAGGLAGAGVGGLVGLGVISGVIPVLGPVIAGGTLAAILANAAGGAVIGTIAGWLVGEGIPEEEADYYRGEFESGRTIVTVHAADRHDEARKILHSHGAHDVHSRGMAGATTAHHEGTTHAAMASPTAPLGSSTSSEGHYPTTGKAHTGAEHAIPVREEEVSVHKRPERAGEVEVHKEVVTEHKTVEVPVKHEEVVVERHPATGQHAAGPIGGEGGKEVRIPVMKEDVTVEKHPVVKEEVSVHKRDVQDTEHVEADVRKEQVHVERKGDADVRDKGHK